MLQSRRCRELGMDFVVWHETRGGGAHFRVDYPERDDTNGLRTIMVEQDLGYNELKVSSEPTGLPRWVPSRACGESGS